MLRVTYGFFALPRQWCYNRLDLPSTPHQWCYTSHESEQQEKDHESILVISHHLCIWRYQSSIRKAGRGCANFYCLLASSSSTIASFSYKYFELNVSILQDAQIALRLLRRCNVLRRQQSFFVILRTFLPRAVALKKFGATENPIFAEI